MNQEKIKNENYESFKLSNNKRTSKYCEMQVKHN